MNNYITIPLYKEIQESNTIPEIYVYLPHAAKRPTKAVIVCGGGGFNQVNLDHEGHLFAQWLNTIEVAGIVLNYRLPNGDKHIPEMDLRQAVKIVRERALEWNIDKLYIGAAGFSIGGHAVSLLAVKEEKESKLDFTMLFYAVISMSDNLAHKPSREKLLGKNPDKDEIEYYSSENYISGSTPKSLIMSSDDDIAVSPLNGVIYYENLKKHNIPASLHIFPSGGHGWGMKKDFPYHQSMLDLVESWMKM